MKLSYFTYLSYSNPISISPAWWGDSRASAATDELEVILSQDMALFKVGAQDDFSKTEKKKCKVK